ncbi:hypothetical protein WN55_10639 [Dufourea novaeangliae]|uniref:PiggyBac transposable element-derived protein domain-containing protein n=1 Tax=Dufourea novaeangliae TaxID=178035 RepID=A0A154P454_DUFNO|nr:hypothetical protein WN55_10639 [Dufourea novaeangliae]
MEVCDSHSSKEVIRPTKRRRIIAMSPENDDIDIEQSVDDFEWEEKNDKPKLHKFISVSGVNKDITSFTRENVYGLVLTEEILEHIVMETNRFGKTFSGLSGTRTGRNHGLSEVLKVFSNPSAQLKGIRHVRMKGNEIRVWKKDWGRLPSSCASETNQELNHLTSLLTGGGRCVFTD